MVVRMRSNRSHTGNRRSHHRLSAPAISIDSKGVPHMRHRASTVTGMYKGRVVLSVQEKLDKKLKKQKSKKEGR